MWGRGLSWRGAERSSGGEIVVEAGREVVEGSCRKTIERRKKSFHSAKSLGFS